MENHPIVVQHCFGEYGLGGPMTEMYEIMTSELSNKYRLFPCFQDRPAGGINLPLIFEMAHRIRHYNPDLLHVRGLQNEGFHGLIAGRIARCRRILVSVHGFIGDLRYPTSRLRQNIVSRLMEPFTLRNADGVYCVCEYASRRAIIKKYARHNYGCIHNGVRIPKMDSPNNSLRQSMGFSPNDIIIISVARITREKGLYDLLKIARIIEASSNRSIKFMIVGDGPDLPKLKRIASNEFEHKFIFLGQRNDVPDLLKISNIFLLPTLHENLSISVLEAMSYGLPVITTEVGGNPEVVVNGETGILVAPENPQEMAGSVLLLANDADLRSRMGRAGRHRIISQFSISTMAEKLDQIYRNILS